MQLLELVGKFVGIVVAPESVELCGVLGYTGYSSRVVGNSSRRHGTGQGNVIGMRKKSWLGVERE